MKSSFLNKFLEKIFHTYELSQLRPEVIDLRRKIKESEIELEEKKQLLDVTKKEYDRLNTSSRENITLAKNEEIIDLFKDLSTNFSQLNTMKKSQEEGKEVRINDLFRLVKQIEKIFEKKGVIRIGEPGEKVFYDNASHQPIGDFTPTDKEEVTIRFCGYRTKDKLIKRALVGSLE